MNDMPDQNPDPPVEHDAGDDPPSPSVPPRTLSRAGQRLLLRGLILTMEILIEDDPVDVVHYYNAAASVSIFLSAIADGEEWR